jgi:hypothetical protein
MNETGPGCIMAEGEAITETAITTDAGSNRVRFKFIGEEI